MNEGALVNRVTKTQCDMVLRYMQETGSITPLEALSEFGIMRLGARIWDLRNAGHTIKREMVSHKNRYGKTISFAQYSLVEDVTA